MTEKAKPLTAEEWIAKVDIERARSAHTEIGDALKSLEFLMLPETLPVHMKRIANAVDDMANALGMLPGPEHPSNG